MRHLPNLVISMGVGSDGKFSCLISDRMCDLSFTGSGSQCFPLYYYEKQKPPEVTAGGLFGGEVLE